MKYFFLTLINLLVASSFIFSVHLAAAQGPLTDVCKTTPQAAVCQEVKKTGTTNPLYGPGSLLAKVTSLVALIVGIASVIVIIIGGIKFAVSGGDSNSVNSARNTVLYAVFGLALAAAAQIIVVFVIDRL